MNSLSSGFANQVNADPDADYTVMITQKSDVDEPDFADTRASIQPVEGLKGIYKARLTGHEILRLQHNEKIQTIESDDLDFHALGQD